MIDEQNDVMFTEYAETIVRFNQVNPIEDDSQYYQLLLCPFVSLQKSAYISLKLYFERKQIVQT